MESVFGKCHLLILLLPCQEILSEMITVRVLEKPGAPNSFFDNSKENGDEILTGNIKPANFSGPLQLRRLQGKCFSTIVKNYKYHFCPFQNITQHEQDTYRPYNGIIGVWQEWIIENNTFRALLMGEGDACGSKKRQARVELACGRRNALVNVSEPATCEYLAVMTSPLVCHPHALLVYPTLGAELRGRWDHAASALRQGYITALGYEKILNEIFIAAGYKLSDEEKIALKSTKESQSGPYSSLDTCNKEYQALTQVVHDLRELVKKDLRGEEDTGYLGHGVNQLDAKVHGQSDSLRPNDSSPDRGGDIGEHGKELPDADYDRGLADAKHPLGGDDSNRPPKVADRMADSDYDRQLGEDANDGGGLEPAAGGGAEDVKPDEVVRKVVDDVDDEELKEAVENRRLEEVDRSQNGAGEPGEEAEDLKVKFVERLKARNRAPEQNSLARRRDM